MSGVDLVTFLRARLDEDEREATWAAEEAGGAAWAIRSTDVVLADDTDRYVSGNAQNEVRDHIARYDPQFVLADVAAKRRIVALYEEAYDRVRNPVSADARAAARVGQFEIEGVLRLLAAPFAAHPDFDPAWIPSAGVRRPSQVQPDVGRRRYGDGMNTTWREELTAAMDKASDPGPVVAVAPDDATLDVIFDEGHGSSQGPSVLIWTEQRVYFPVTYDGSEWLGSAPRDPQADGQEHVGGE